MTVNSFAAQAGCEGAGSGVPGPVGDLGQVGAVLADPGLVAGAGVGHGLAYGGGAYREAGDAVDDVHDEAVAVEVVADDHVEGCGGGAGLLVSAHVQVLVAGAAVGEGGGQAGGAGGGGDHRLVLGGKARGI